MTISPANRSPEASRIINDDKREFQDISHPDRDSIIHSPDLSATNARGNERLDPDTNGRDRNEPLEMDRKVLDFPLSTIQREEPNLKTGKPKKKRVPVSKSRKRESGSKKGKTVKAPRAPASSKIDLSFLPVLPDPFFWQKTSSGASLMKDHRKIDGSRPYIGHFSVRVLEAVYRDIPLESRKMSEKKLILEKEKEDSLRELLKQIAEEAAA